MTRRRAGRAILSLAAALLPIPAFAQLAPSEKAQIKLDQAPAPPPASDDIVVTAPPPPKVSAVTKQAEAVTPQMDKRQEPLPQFQTWVCPGVVGLPREVAELIVDRVRYDAERVGIRVAHADKCSPNILIVVTRSGGADVKALMKRSPYLFADMSSVELRELENEAGPVHAWSTVVRRGKDGQSYSGGYDLGAGMRAPVLSEWAAHSKIYLTTRLEIESSVLLLDVAAINGLSVNQIADYAAMRTLVRTRPPQGEGAVPTILTLFDPNGRAPLELSAFDLAYLRETYGSDANMPAYGKLADVGRDLREAAKRSKHPDASAAATPQQSNP